MPRTLNQFIATRPKYERAKIAARARELIAEEKSLRRRKRLRGAGKKPRTTAAGRRLDSALEEVLADVRGTKRLPIASRF